MKKIIFINFLFTILLLFCAEFFFRYILNYNVQGISKNIITNNGEFEFNNKNIKKGKAFGANVYTDSNGFRIPKKFKRKNLNQILFIGGSITFGVAVESENTFVEKLNQNSDFMIINASVMGSTLNNNYKILSKFYNKEKTNKVFVSLALDDFNDATDDQPANLKKSLKSIKIFFNIHSFLLKQSAAYVFFKSYLINPKKEYYLKEISGFKNPEILVKFNSTLDKYSGYKDKIIFYIIPYAEQVTSQECVNNDISQKIFERELSNRNLKFINFKRYFCEQKNTKKLFLMNDPAHLSKKGHQLVFSILKNYIY
jgi:hypothetical protein